MNPTSLALIALVLAGANPPKIGRGREARAALRAKKAEARAARTRAGQTSALEARGEKGGGQRLDSMTPAIGPDGPPAPPYVLDAPVEPLDTSAMEKAAVILRQKVAYLRATKPIEIEGVDPEMVDGWAVVTSTHAIACQWFLVKDAELIEIVGPTGTATATFETGDGWRRWAMLRVDRPLHQIGLYPAAPSPVDAREVGMDVFALVATDPGAGLVFGTLTETSDKPYLEGNIRADLALRRGMPAFDAHLRWMGLSRTVAWDRDPTLLVPPEVVLERRRGNPTEGREGIGESIEDLDRSRLPAPWPPRDGESDRPWWAR